MAAVATAGERISLRQRFTGPRAYASSGDVRDSGVGLRTAASLVAWGRYGGAWRRGADATGRRCRVLVSVRPHVSAPSGPNECVLGSTSCAYPSPPPWH